MGTVMAEELLFHQGMRTCGRKPEQKRMEAAHGQAYQHAEPLQGCHMLSQLLLNQPQGRSVLGSCSPGDGEAEEGEGCFRDFPVSVLVLVHDACPGLGGERGGGGQDGGGGGPIWRCFSQRAARC